jgi:phosphatidylglycerophosphatase C
VYDPRVRTATVADVIGSIENHAREAPGGAVAFDGDGTLWSGDIGEDFFAALLVEDRLTQTARDALAREAAAEGLDTAGSPVEIAHRIHAAYLAGTFPEERVCEIMTWACAGWTRDELDAFATRVMGELGLPARLHGEALRVARWAEERGIAVFLVSASPRAIVDAAARVLGVAVAGIAAATEAVDDRGVVLPSVERPIPYGPGKVTRIREKLGARVLYAAFGDNAFDVALLREAKVPVAIRPKPRLVDRAAEVPDLVILDRE